MADAPDGPTQALADRYAIDREIGAGGMATVHLVADLKDTRRVGIRVVRPQVAAALVGGVVRVDRPSRHNRDRQWRGKLRTLGAECEI